MHCFPIVIQLVFICGQELLLQPVSALINTHTRARTQTHTGRTTVCLMGWEPGVMISPESAELWAEAALTAAAPQVGQRGTTALGMHSCPPDPLLGSAANPVDVWLRCVWSKIRPSTASAPKNLLDSRPPAAAPLTTSSLPGALRVNGTVEQREAFRSENTYVTCKSIPQANLIVLGSILDQFYILRK